jgi:hypothetical protein
MSEETNQTGPAGTSETPQAPLPPASIGELVFSLRLQAELHLGLLGAEDEKEKPQADLPAAQHFIDLLGVLAEKTRGNLTLEEQRYLENSLTELRFRFVQAAGSQAK